MGPSYLGVSVEPCGIKLVQGVWVTWPYRSTHSRSLDPRRPRTTDASLSVACWLPGDRVSPCLRDCVPVSRLGLDGRRGPLGVPPAAPHVFYAAPPPRPRDVHEALDVAEDSPVPASPFPPFSLPLIQIPNAFDMMLVALLLLACCMLHHPCCLLHTLACTGPPAEKPFLPVDHYY